jgi:hypothetical protein
LSLFVSDQTVRIFPHGAGWEPIESAVFWPILHFPTVTLGIYSNFGGEIMTRSILIVICTLSLLTAGAVGALAQTDKGGLVFMGTAAFTTSSGDLYGGSSLTTLELSPRAYYFVADQVGVGGRLGFVNASTSGLSTTSIAFGPDAVYFFKTSSDNLLPFAGAGLFITSASISNGHSSSASGFTFSLHGGLAYLLKEHLAIFPELSLDLQNQDSNSGTTIMLGVGLAGFLY